MVDLQELIAKAVPGLGRLPDPRAPRNLPPGRVVHVPGHGELFCRDSGGAGQAVLLLHGWLVTADMNWFRAYQDLIDAGYRVVALDHRGHGRGLRRPEPFRLSDCAGDAAALVEELGCGPVLAVGYSMGGPIAQLLARDHPDLVCGLVLCATSLHWKGRRESRMWKGMGLVQVGINIFPHLFWKIGVHAGQLRPTPVSSWLVSELSRGDARDLAEAGRELGRYDGTEGIERVEAPVAVIVTARDEDVPPRRQRRLADAHGAPAFEVDGQHLAVTTNPDRFNPVLLTALGNVADRAGRCAPTATPA
ncbi:MAG: alpha/beta fold hydrolase [Solirubrobacterales bacterium]